MALREEEKLKLPDLDRQSFQKITKLFIEFLHKEYDFDDKQIQTILDKATEPTVPIIIFNSKLGCLETITKYLIEEKHMKNSQVAKLTSRSPKTIWATYYRAKQKMPEPLSTNKFLETDEKKQSSVEIPISILSNKEFSILESIVHYLRKNHGMSLRQISELLHRAQGTIAAIYHRVKQKDE